MPNTPERRAEAPPVPDGVVERREEFIVPEKIQDIAKSTHVAPPQVTDDSGQQLIGDSSKKTVVIQINADPAKLDELVKKTTPTDAIRWLATFWIRMLKKAAHFGWKIVGGKGGDAVN